MFPLHKRSSFKSQRIHSFLSSRNYIKSKDFMFPMFIAEGENVQVEISMPGIFAVL
jgi:porphobilinogen synthase